MRRLAVVRVSLWIAISLSIALAASLAGCRCGGTGGSCNENSDCPPGDYCDPVTLTCVTIDSGPPPTDSGNPGVDSGGPGVDAGTDAAACPDADGDGFGACNDCDDTDPLTYPGAPEVCGDGVTNDCDSSAAPDTGCGGIGTYVAPPPVGSPANPGTQALPVDTINQGIINAMTIGGGVDVYVAADVAGPGLYVEDIVMVDGISLYGGYESAAWTRDPAVNVTVITATVAVGLTFGGTIARTTELDGFTVNGAGGNGGSGAAITIYDGSEPTVSNNVINGPGTGGASRAIDINPSGGPNTASPLITGNVITIGSSAGGWGGAGGYGISTPDTPSEIRRNSITLAADDTIQRGIEAVPGSTGLVIANNVIGPPAAGSSDWAFGIRVGGGEATIDSNSVAMGSCFTYCAGITIGGAITATITNNVAFGGAAPTSFGLSIEYEGVPASMPDILVHSNFFDGAGTAASTGGSSTLSAGVGLGENPAAPIVAGRFYDNIIYSGIGSVRYAIRENHINIDPEFLDSNALYVETTPPALTSALYLDEGVTPLITPALVDVAGASAGANNIEDACGVMSPIPGGDFHIPAGSACIDTGNAAELPLYDFEGDTRPAGAGPDIGVDET